MSSRYSGCLCNKSTLKMFDWLSYIRIRVYSREESVRLVRIPSKRLCEVFPLSSVIISEEQEAILINN